ncbi:MAG: HDOD domain-containing protein [Candidatus Eisenbacteria sp.]|nr:HDOD domain-containing protein [Candidatus Eisenbacteria bacterium]
MTQPEATPSESGGISVARQAIFDQQRRLWGYEVFCVGNIADTPSGVPTDEDISVSFAASAGVGLQRIIAREKHVLVNLTEKSIMDEHAYALPSARTTVLVSEDVYRKPAVGARLEQLKADGFRVAVRGFSGAQDCEDLYQLADIIDIAVQDQPGGELALTVASACTYEATLLASQVPDATAFAACQELGFDLFEGGFSKAPEIVPMRKIASSQVTRFNLLKVLESDDQDVKALAETIQTDAAISFRLLTHLNSAAFGFSHKIKSIHHAIGMLGWRQIKNWLRVVILSDVNQDSDDSDLLLVSAQRAKFLELTAQRYSFWGFEPESMHLLGLFSLLDTMIGVPMKEIVEYLPLDGKLKAALCGAPDSEYLPLMTLVQDLEEARWEEAEAAMNQLNLDSAGTKAAFQEAVAWAAELTVLMEGK